MKKANHLFVIALLILTSCSGDSESATSTSNDVIDKNIKVVTTELVGSSFKNTAAIVIEGMSCERACVSSINKTVVAMNGTSNINIHFNASNTTDTCYVDYDENVVSPNDLVEAIQKCNGGVYTVKAIELLKTVPQGAVNTRSSKGASDTRTREQVKHAEFSFPSLLDLIKKVGL